MVLGGVLSLSNLYIVLKTGWSFGVTITAGILAFALFSLAGRLRLLRTPFTLLENNASQSVASAAGYMTGGGTAAAIPAVMMITGQRMDPWQMFFWITAIAFLGVIMAIPMKQQMIDVEQLRFPSGIAAAETLRALYADDTGAGAEAGRQKARLLGIGAVLGAVVAFLRDFEGSPLRIPEKLELPGTLRGRPLADFTLSVDASLLLVAGGAIMGWRAAWSLLLGAVVNYAGLAPVLYAAGVLPEKLGYKNIVGWSVWFGATMLLTSGLVSFAFQWRSVLAAFRSIGAAFRGALPADGQVPMSWFVTGMVGFGAAVVGLEYLLFGIAPWLGVISVVLGFFTAIVACRVTGETDTTPSGALGKVTQITFGVLAPGSVTTNLMTANVTAGVGLHSADLLTDLKSGWLLGADPKQQFWGQFLGVVAGSAFVVPAYNLLIRDPADLGGDKWPVPGAQTWKGVAEMLAKGIESLHPTAQIAIGVGAALGIGMAVLEHYVPRVKRWMPSPTGFGLGFTVPAYNAISMFLGALVAYVMEKRAPALAERTVVATSSGLIAGESLMGVAIAIWAARDLVGVMFG
jgi:uncharacterized oligopeptide transporter (OPT) family protein